MFMVNNRFFAFTLAEVLITLGVIGIVAAMTIPTLLNKTNDEEYRAGLKKAYSELSQVALFMQNDGYELKSMDLQNSASDQAIFKSEMEKFFKKVKICDDGVAGIEPCVPADTGVYKNMMGGAGDNGAFMGGQFVTSDGMTVMLCGNMYYLSVDVNGHGKKPNRYGVDLFFFQVVGDKILPVGARGTDGFLGDFFDGRHLGSNFCSTASNHIDNGMACTLFILQGLPIPTTIDM